MLGGWGSGVFLGGGGGGKPAPALGAFSQTTNFAVDILHHSL